MSSLGKVLRRLFGPLTTRGRSFLAAGGAAVVCGVAALRVRNDTPIGQPKAAGRGRLRSTDAWSADTDSCALCPCD